MRFEGVVIISFLLGVAVGVVIMGCVAVCIMIDRNS